VPFAVYHISSAKVSTDTCRTCLGHAIVPMRRAAVQKSEGECQPIPQFCHGDGILMAPQEAAGDDVGALESRLRQCRVLQVGSGPMVYVDSMWFLSCLFQKRGMPFRAGGRFVFLCSLMS
jgi:hypothetical protein